MRVHGGAVYSHHHDTQAVGTSELWRREGTPQPGTIWHHYKGGVYTVLGVGEHSSTPGEIGVVYMSAQDGCVWWRPLDQWEQPVTILGIERPRFAIRFGGEG